MAHIISHQCKSGQRYRFVSLSATMSGVNDVKEAVKIAKNEKRLTQKHTVLFIDEVHRFNKMQQVSLICILDFRFIDLSILGFSDSRIHGFVYSQIFRFSDSFITSIIY